MNGHVVSPRRGASRSYRRGSWHVQVEMTHTEQVSVPSALNGTRSDESTHNACDAPRATGFLRIVRKGPELAGARSRHTCSPASRVACEGVCACMRPGRGGPDGVRQAAAFPFKKGRGRGRVACRRLFAWPFVLGLVWSGVSAPHRIRFRVRCCRRHAAGSDCELEAAVRPRLSVR